MVIKQLLEDLKFEIKKIHNSFKARGFVDLMYNSSLPSVDSVNFITVVSPAWQASQFLSVQQNESAQWKLNRIKSKLKAKG